MTHRIHRSRGAPVQRRARADFNRVFGNVVAQAAEFSEAIRADSPTAGAANKPAKSNTVERSGGGEGSGPCPPRRGRLSRCRSWRLAAAGACCPVGRSAGDPSRASNDWRPAHGYWHGAWRARRRGAGTGGHRRAARGGQRGVSGQAWLASERLAAVQTGGGQVGAGGRTPDFVPAAAGSGERHWAAAGSSGRRSSRDGRPTAGDRRASSARARSLTWCAAGTTPPCAPHPNG